MSVIEKTGVMKYKDKDGQVYLMLPITTADKVDGAVSFYEQELSEEEKAQARANIGAISADEVPSVDIPDVDLTGVVKSVNGSTPDQNGNVVVEIPEVDLSGYETTGNASAKLQEAKTYADNAATTVKNDLLNGAGAAYDTLKELGDLIDNNTDALGALEQVAAGKADKDHEHELQVFDLTGIGTLTVSDTYETSISGTVTSDVMNNICNALNADSAAFTVDMGFMHYVIVPNSLRSTSGSEGYVCGYTMLVGDVLVLITFVFDKTASAVSISATPMVIAEHEHEISDVTGLRDELDELAANAGGTTIIDVNELPTENINENAWYRLLSPVFVYNKFELVIHKCYTVDGLPETGELGYDGTKLVAYYNTQDNTAYVYFTEAAASSFGISAGWLTLDSIITSFSPWGGYVTEISQASESSTMYLYLKRVMYQYKDVWTPLNIIGMPGTGNNAEIFNHVSNVASGEGSHAEGYKTTSSGNYSHAEGYKTTASGKYSHAEGASTTASAEGSHAEGVSTTASGWISHAEGYGATASGEISHAEGIGTVANSQAQHVQGQYNVADTPDADTNMGKYVHIIGNGSSDTIRSNAHTVDWDGNAWYAGDVYVGGTGQDDSAAKKLVTSADLEIPTIDLTALGLPAINYIDSDYDQAKVTLTDDQMSEVRAKLDNGVVTFKFKLLVDTYNDNRGNNQDTTYVDTATVIVTKTDSGSYKSEFVSINANESTNISILFRTDNTILTTAYNIEKKMDRPVTAEAGQVIAVKSVDDYGRPYQFEAIDLPTGGGSSSSGSSVQPDWNQNDPTAADYVKNRTHWVEETELMAETEITTVEEDGAYVYYPTEPLFNYANAVDGDTCSITFDGTTYDSSVFYDSEFAMTIIGNGRVFGLALTGDEETLDLIIASGDLPAVLGKGNGEPFVMIIGLNDTGMVFTEEAGTYTMSISGMVYHVIDHKYLMPGLPWIEEGAKVFDGDITTISSTYGNIATDDLIITGDAVFTAGTTVKTICDDVEYESPVTLLSNRFYFIGNIYLYLEYNAAANNQTVDEYLASHSYMEEYNKDTGEPFLIEFYYEDKVTMYYTKEATTYNIQIYGTVYHEMDSRFLPEIDALPTVSDTDEGKVLSVENGSWAVTKAPSGLPEVTTEDNNKTLIVVDGVWTAVTIEYGDEVAY